MTTDNETETEVRFKNTPVVTHYCQSARVDQLGKELQQATAAKVDNVTLGRHSDQSDSITCLEKDIPAMKKQALKQ